MEAVKELEKSLKCQKCLQFDCQMRLYVLNQCQHHMCASCLNSLSNNYMNQYVCWICKRPSHFTVTKLPTAFSNSLSQIKYLIAKHDDVEKSLRNENAVLKKEKARWNMSQKDLYKCAECEKGDSEQNMQLCETCHGLKFENLEDVKRHGLCAGCAIKKHIRKGHQTVDFYPYLSAYNFSLQSSVIRSKSEEFEKTRETLNNTFSNFSALSITVSENYNLLTNMAQRSKTTRHQIEFIEKVRKFIDESKVINIETDSEVKKCAAKMEANLANIKEWYESKMENCVDGLELVKLANSDGFDNINTLIQKLRKLFN